MILKIIGSYSTVPTPDFEMGRGERGRKERETLERIIYTIINRNVVRDL